eukprot:6028138-Prorocentrum_lima.AAC.1
MEPDTKLDALSNVDDFTWDLVDQSSYNLKLNDAHFKSPMQKTDCLNKHDNFVGAMKANHLMLSDTASANINSTQGNNDGKTL